MKKTFKFSTLTSVLLASSLFLVACSDDDDDDNNDTNSPPIIIDTTSTIDNLKVELKTSLTTFKTAAASNDTTYKTALTAHTDYDTVIPSEDKIVFATEGDAKTELDALCTSASITTCDISSKGPILVEYRKQLVTKFNKFEAKEVADYNKFKIKDGSNNPIDTDQNLRDLSSSTKLILDLEAKNLSGNLIANKLKSDTSWKFNITRPNWIITPPANNQ